MNREIADKKAMDIGMENQEAANKVRQILESAPPMLFLGAGFSVGSLLQSLSKGRWEKRSNRKLNSMSCRMCVNMWMIRLGKKRSSETF